jgi:uncharacterized protein YneF (UPF0154 family)
MNVGPLELLLLMVFVICLLGPVIAGAYLATRLSRRAPGRPPTAQ